MFGKRILILIPHPDDEVEDCGAAIARARKRGSSVYGLYLGHGCLPRKTLWPWQRVFYQKRVARRVFEAECAARFLGITIVKSNSQRAAREIWPQLPHVLQGVLRAIEFCDPDSLWVPACEGGNPDHDALNAMSSTIKNVNVFEFSEYHFNGGHVHSQGFIKRYGGEIVHRLTRAERCMKRTALSLYASEKSNLRNVRLGAIRSLRSLGRQIEDDTLTGSFASLFEDQP
jgi:GlcNAc-PI de-N-acetylase